MRDYTVLYEDRHGVRATYRTRAQSRAQAIDKFHDEINEYNDFEVIDAYLTAE